MLQAKKLCALLVAMAGAGLVGCAPKMDKETLQNMKPERPAQLDMLNDFVGTWVGTSEATMCGMDETCKGSGTSTISWDLDNNILVESSEWTSDAMGTMKGRGVWSWDAKRNRFRMNWYDTWGSYGEGYAKVSDDGKTWTIKATSHSPMGTTIGRGTMTFVDRNTMEMTWKEYCCGGLMKVFEMKGTSTRQ